MAWLLPRVGATWQYRQQKLANGAACGRHQLEREAASCDVVRYTTRTNDSGHCGIRNTPPWPVGSTLICRCSPAQLVPEGYESGAVYTGPLRILVYVIFPKPYALADDLQKYR